MQYILTQEEYDDLKKKREALEHIERKELQKLCTKIANEMPVEQTDFHGGSRRSTPNYCILDGDGKRDHYESNTEYCDDCPVKKICPYPYKEWSK